MLWHTDLLCAIIILSSNGDGVHHKPQKMLITPTDNKDMLSVGVIYFC